MKLERQKKSLHTVVQDGLVHSSIGVGPDKIHPLPSSVQVALSTGVRLRHVSIDQQASQRLRQLSYVLMLPAVKRQLTVEAYTSPWRTLEERMSFNPNQL